MSAEIAVVDPASGRPSGPNTVGEIWVSGPSVTAGYWNRPAATAAQFTTGPDGRAWLRTGDLGFELDGELFVTGRDKDLIIIRGRNVHPSDIENTVAAAVGRGGCAAFSVEVNGEERLVVVQETSAPNDGLVAAIRGAVSREHALDVHRVMFLRPGQLPRTTSWKTRRGAARELFLAREEGRDE